MDDIAEEERAAQQAERQRRIDGLSEEERRRFHDPFYEPDQPAEEPNVKARRKGRAAYQKGTPRYQAAVEKARTPIPALATIHWMQAQFRDEGAEKKGRTRYSIKLEFTDLRLEHCRNANLLQQRSEERWANLSTVRRFKINVRDNKTLGDDIRAIAKRVIEGAERHELAVEDVPDYPQCWIGSFHGRYGGTHVYPGQYALVRWMPVQECDDILPMLTITQPGGNGMLTRDIQMRTPNPVNRDGSPRDPKSPYLYVGTFYSPELQARIDEGKRIKAEKEKRQ